MNKRIFTANWTPFPAFDLAAPVDISTLTEDEQAELIVKRLGTHPIDRSTEEKLMEIIAKSIADEIDAEILKGTYK
jgi:hypothetical protein